LHIQWSCIHKQNKNQTIFTVLGHVVEA
jgi:hypothetical protein